MALAVLPKLSRMGTSSATASQLASITSRTPSQEVAVCVKPGTSTTFGTGALWRDDGPRRHLLVREHARGRMGPFRPHARGRVARLPQHAARAGARARRTP